MLGLYLKHTPNSIALIKTVVPTLQSHQHSAGLAGGRPDTPARGMWGTYAGPFAKWLQLETAKQYGWSEFLLLTGGQNLEQ